MESENSSATIGRVIQDFYDKHDFGEKGGIHEKYAWIKFGFFSIPILNVAARKNNVYLHDISHIVTGYDTTWKGESAVSAWEIAAGGWANLYLPWVLTLWAMGLGVVFYPSNILSAFKRGRTMNNALTSGLSKKDMYALSVSDFKQIISNKPKRNKNPYLWMFVALCTFLAPFAIGMLAIWMLIEVFC